MFIPSRIGTTFVAMRRRALNRAVQLTAALASHQRSRGAAAAAIKAPLESPQLRDCNSVKKPRYRFLPWRVACGTINSAPGSAS